MKNVILSFLILPLLFTQTLFADEFPGYIGSRSFRLSDDQQLNIFNQQFENYRLELERTMSSVNQLNDQAIILERQMEGLKRKMAEIDQTVNANNKTIAANKAQVAELSKNAEANKAQIDTLNNTIATLTASNQSLLRTIGQYKMELGPVATRFDQVIHDRDTVAVRANQQRERLQNYGRQVENYRRDLISQIMQYNQSGANYGSSDGNSDGLSLAISRADSFGTKDGSIDGAADGTSFGKDREYKNGYADGAVIGNSRAQDDGARDGRILGTKEGNIAAATNDGSIDGEARAEKSDAVSVGKKQGEADGLLRATNDGNRIGTKNGEQETIKKFEAYPLKEVVLKGAFAGSFARRSPNYPGDDRGPKYDPENVRADREILKKAYVDAYVYKYFERRSANYNDSIDQLYYRTYDSNYNDNYNRAKNVYYQEDYNSGKNRGDSETYAANYPVIKEANRKVYRQNKTDNPDKSSKDYTATYKQVEKETYTTHYEELRLQSFTDASALKYKNSIEEQKEIFRQKRIAEVTTLYSQNGILAFHSSSLTDAGLNGVSVLDGIYLPGENAAHSVTILNYGLKSVAGLKIKSNAGEVASLPEIPAQSKTTIQYAALSTLPSQSVGTNVNLTLQVVAPFNTKDLVEVAHFDNPTKGVLKAAEVKSVKLQYPFNLSTLALSSPLLKGVSSKLSLVASNISQIAYNGELRLDVETNLNSNIISKNFTSLAQVNNGQAGTFSDAEVLVTDFYDAYKDIALSATLSLNGVVIGKTSNDLVTMAKAGFEDKKGKPVLVADTNKNLKFFLDTLSDFGGSDNVAVLDLTLGSLNQNVLNGGLANKSIVVVDDDAANTSRNLDNFFRKSADSNFVIAAPSANLLEAVKSMPALRDAQRLAIDSMPVLMSNPFGTDGISKSSSFVFSTLDTADKFLPVSNMLAMNPDSLMEAIKGGVTREAVNTPNLLVKVYSLKSLNENLDFAYAYNKSGNIFTRKGSWVDKIEKEGQTFFNRLRNSLPQSADNNNVGLFIAAQAMSDFVNNGMKDARTLPKAQLKADELAGRLNDDIKNRFKSFDRDLYSTLMGRLESMRPYPLTVDNGR